MPTLNQAPKPVSKGCSQQITNLARLTRTRILVRRFYQTDCRTLLRAVARIEVEGIEKFSSQSPALIVTNHLGDADIQLGLGELPIRPEVFAKTELRDIAFLGWLMNAYGAIWLHQGKPDHRTLSLALRALSKGCFRAIAPE
jgi:1-acyl-sn-glycerol-3-phosphate acyltransferase